MSTTSEAIADTISEQYASAMDDAFADARKMETQRDEALVQLATDRREASILRVKVWALAQKVDECLAMITELGARELQGNTCGPVQLLAEGWTNPRPRQDFTRQDAEEVADRVGGEMLQSPEMQEM
jgi:hypothetical protein